MLLRETFIATLSLAAVSGQTETLAKLSCGEGYTLLGLNCYLVSEETHGGADASHFCDSQNGTVAVIESEEELDLLRGGFLQATVYLGLNLQDNREKLFEYALKLSGHSGYTSLKAGEPNNLGGEDCFVADFSANWNMADVRCTETHAVLCKAAAAVRPVEIMTCQPGAYRFDKDTCYWIDAEQELTWRQAGELCNSKGMELASFHSQAEQDFITGKGGQLCWIGLHDKNKNDTYEWTDGTPFDYENWYSGEPDLGDEDCVEIGTTDRWYDFDCTAKRGVVCKGPPDVVMEL